MHPPGRDKKLHPVQQQHKFRQEVHFKENYQEEQEEAAEVQLLLLPDVQKHIQQLRD